MIGISYANLLQSWKVVLAMELGHFIGEISAEIVLWSCEFFGNISSGGKSCVRQSIFVSFFLLRLS